MSAVDRGRGPRRCPPSSRILSRAHRWERVAPLLPARPSQRQRLPGGKPVDDRAALAGIVFVRKTAIAWHERPTTD
ncbi:MAG: transposase [Nocardioidaceae bacterium]